MIHLPTTHAIHPLNSHGTLLDAKTKGFVVFLADCIRLGLAWLAPYLAFRIAETATAATAPDLLPEITGATIILTVGGLVVMLLGPLRKPVRRVLHWALSEEGGFAGYTSH